MKKTGFTLAELLITLGIIGVVSALTFSIATKLTPDKNKVLCLKAFDTISKTVKELAADSKVYPTCKDANSDNNVNCKDYPLFNTNRTSAFNNDLYSGDKKLCSLLAYSMGVNEANISCSDTPYAFNADSFNNDFSSNLSFTTQNGMQWRIVPQVASSAVGTTGTYQTDIYVDINGSEAPNCIYNNDTCEKPDRFKFMVAATGQVYAADPYSVQYVTTRKSFLKTKSEIDDSSVIVANLPQDRTFALGQCRTPLTEQERCAKEGKYWYDNSCHNEPKPNEKPVVCTKKTVPELLNIVKSAHISYDLPSACYYRESVFFNGSTSAFIENYTVGQLYNDNSVLYLVASKDVGGGKLSNHYNTTKNNFGVILSGTYSAFAQQGLDSNILSKVYNDTINETFANVDAGRIKMNHAQKGSNCQSLAYVAGKVRDWDSNGIVTGWDADASDSFYSVVRAGWVFEQYLSKYADKEYQQCLANQ